MATLSDRIGDLATRIATEVAGKSIVSAGQNVGDSFTLTATAGRTLVIWAGGAHGSTTSAAVIDLNYNGAVIATHPIRQGSATNRSGYALVGVVTAVASATCSITVTLGTLYDPKIVWLEIG